MKWVILVYAEAVNRLIQVRVLPDRYGHIYRVIRLYTDNLGLEVPEGYRVRLKVRGHEAYVDEDSTCRQVQDQYGRPENVDVVRLPARYERDTLPGVQLLLDFHLCEDSGSSKLSSSSEM
jgi:hypothetical protein